MSKITRNQAIEIANAILQANFDIYGRGHFDITFSEIVNIIMIVANSKGDMKEKLSRYYGILERKYMYDFSRVQEYELRRVYRKEKSL